MVVRRVPHECRIVVEHAGAAIRVDELVNGCDGGIEPRCFPEFPHEGESRVDSRTGAAAAGKRRCTCPQLGEQSRSYAPLILKVRPTIPKQKSLDRKRQQVAGKRADAAADAMFRDLHPATQRMFAIIEVFSVKTQGQILHPVV